MSPGVHRALEAARCVRARGEALTVASLALELGVCVSTARRYAWLLEDDGAFVRTRNRWGHTAYAVRYAIEEAAC